MKLPEIDYLNPVQSTVGTAALPYEAAKGLANVISEGLSAYHQELIKTEVQQAGVEVAKGLNQADLVIKSRQYISAQEIRDTLGENIPTHVAERLEVVDPVTQEKTDNQQIPMWAVADALYAHAANKVIAAAASRVTGTGWQNAFKDHIAGQVVERQQGMAAYQLRALDTYLQQTQLQQIDGLVNERDFGGAMAALRGATALPPETRQKLRDSVEAAKQEAPAHDAALSTNPADILSEITRLKTDKAARAIPDARRVGLIAGLENRYNHFDASAIASEAVQSGVVPGSRIIDEEKVFAQLSREVKNKTPEVQTNARQLVKAQLSDFTEARKNETSKVFAMALADFIAPGADGKPRNARAFVRPEAAAYLSNPANGREAVELWQHLGQEEEAAKLRGRSLAAQPTEANWAAYGVLVKDMLDNPATYRKMDAARFTADVYGKVGPLISQAMALYKSTNEPTADKRVLAGEERKAMLEALPPEFRPDKNTPPGSTEGQVWSLMEQRIGDRKAKEWDNNKGPVPPGIVKGWVQEEWASGTVKGGRFFGFLDRGGVPKAVAPVKYPGKEFIPDQTAAPAPTPAQPTGNTPAIGTRVPGEAIGKVGGEYERVVGGWKRVR